MVESLKRSMSLAFGGTGNNLLLGYGCWLCECENNSLICTLLKCVLFYMYVSIKKFFKSSFITRSSKQ